MFWNSLGPKLRYQSRPVLPKLKFTDEIHFLSEIMSEEANKVLLFTFYKYTIISTNTHTNSTNTLY